MFGSKSKEDKATLKQTKKGKGNKSHGTEKRGTLSAYTKRTLGSGNLRVAVRVPEGEDFHEWLAANTVDFFNELSLLYGLVLDEGDGAKKYTKAGEGFPPGFEYRWGDGNNKTISVSGPEYVDYVLSWIEDQIDNEEIFPVEVSVSFPENFEEYVRDIFKRMFRLFAILYHSFFEDIEKLDAAAHLNTSFKHFYFYCKEFSLVEEKEFKALKGPTDRLQKEFNADE